MSRSIWVRGGLILSVLWLCDCVSTDAPEGIEYRAPAQEGPGAMQIAHLGRPGGDTDAFLRLKENFESRNPGYTMDWSARLVEAPSTREARVRLRADRRVRAR